MTERILRTPPPDGRAKYPWDKWADGKWREVDPAKHNTDQATLAASVYAYAARNSRKAQVRRLGNGNLAFCIPRN